MKYTFILILSILFCIIGPNSYAKSSKDDYAGSMGPFLADLIEMPKDFKISEEELEEGSVYIQSLRKKKEQASQIIPKEKTPFIPGMSLTMPTKVMPIDALRSSDQALLGKYGNSKNYIEYNTGKLIRKNRKLGRKDISFDFIYDSYDYKNSDDAFDVTYRGKEADFSGMLLFTGHSFFYRGAIDLGHGVGFGVGYNGGKGRFVSDLAVSEAQFYFWTLPVDYSLIAQFHLGTRLSFSFAGGPSVIGAIQYRNDFPQGHKRKITRQFSPGAFAMAKLKISLTEFFPKASRTLLQGESVTKYYLSFLARAHSYSLFRTEDVSITGVSFGIGLNFEYI